VLNRRVVDFDGDIPMEKLMELQSRLKNKEGPVEAKPASFITSKETQLIKEGRMLAQSRPTNQVPKPHHPQQSQPPQQPQQPQQQSQPRAKQESFDINSFWNPSAKQPVSTSSNKFDAFSNFFQTSTEPAKKQNSLTDMYS
jgi:hypothetical protein